MGPVAQLVFKTSAVVQPTARSVRLRRRSVEPKPARQAGFGVFCGPVSTVVERWREKSRRE
jgi:hypothetical protein